MFTSAVLLVDRLPGRRARHRHRAAVAGLPRLRRHRRHRPGHRLHLAGLHADQVVPRPPGPGHRHGDHGLRRRRDDRQPAVAASCSSFYDPDFDGTAGTVASGDAVAHAVRHPRPRLPRRHDVRRLHGPGARRGLEARGLRPARRSRQKALVTTDNVSAANAIKTPQFWLLWIVLFCNVTAGIGILEQAAPMIQDFFREGDASTVAAAAAAGFVGRAVAVQHGRPVRLVVDLRRTSAASRSTCSTSASAWCSTSLLATVGQHRDLIFVLLAGAHHQLLRRRLRHRAGVPARPVRHLPGRRHPRPAADRLVGRRRRRAADRQRHPRHPGRAGQR